MVVANLIQGFADAITPLNLYACFIGSLLGTIIGVLPGIGPATAMALLLPVTFNQPASTSLIMLAGLYYGAMYGGSTTSILLNMPGESASVVTCFDGYQMARKGRAGAALAVSAIGSWIAGTLAVVGLMLFAPALARLALMFGPVEYFAFALLGLLFLNNLTGDSFLKSTMIMILGLMIGTVGTDITYGSLRLNFGIIQLSDGMEILSVLMGLFALTEILDLVGGKEEIAKVVKVRFLDLYPTRDEIKRSIKPIFRGLAVGFPCGLLPGPAHIISTMISYKLEKSISRHPEEFGKGAIEGVAGPESANNAAATGAMVPLFALGLPFTVQAAILVGALRMHGITPSPLLISQHAGLFWALIASMYIGNVMLLILNLPLVGIFASLIKTPVKILIPIITCLMITGAYSVNNDVFEMWMVLLFGVIGFVMKKMDYSPIPLIIGMVIGPFFEESLRQALTLAQGDFLTFFQRPVAGTLLTITIVVILWGLGGKQIKQLAVGFRRNGRSGFKGQRGGSE